MTIENGDPGENIGSGTDASADAGVDVAQPGDGADALESSRRVERLLAEYGESHRNIVNKLIHWFAVPVIAWCVLALIWTLPFPESLKIIPGLNWAWIASSLAIVYYLTLSLPIALGMIVFFLFSFALIGAYLNWGDLPLWQLAIAMFLVAWIFQFIGHKIEGRQPSFLEDLQFLLIGPAWLIAALYRLFGIKY